MRMADRVFFIVRLPFLTLFRLRTAKNTGRLDQQNDDQNRKYNAVLPDGKTDCRNERFEKTNGKAADHRAGDRADTAEDGGNERLQAQHRAHRGRRLLIGAQIQDRADTGKRRADGERKGDRSVQADAHQLCRAHILRHGAHGLAELRLLHNDGQGSHGNDGHNNGQQRCVADGHRAERNIARNNGIHALRIGAKEQLRAVSRRNEIPIAVISRLSLGALRNGV